MVLMTLGIRNKKGHHKDSRAGKLSRIGSITHLSTTGQN